jgi:hypothetical protein
LSIWRIILLDWQCDITQVKETALTDDVVQFMAQQLQKLPSSTQEILKLAACIGNQFDLMNLALVSQQSENQTADLQPLKRVAKIQSYLEQRAKLIPGDIRHKCDLIRAECDRVLGNHLQAQAYYDLAILGAK